jgi:hypothetical protein
MADELYKASGTAAEEGAESATTSDSESQDNDREEEEEEWDDPLADDEELQKAFLSLYLECSAEDRYPRLLEVKDVKQAENYWAGRQYWYWSDKDETWKPAPGVGVSPSGDLDLDEMPRFEFVTNIYQSRGLMFIGAVAGAPPRYRFFPTDSDNPADTDAADGRTKLSRLIWRWNPAQLLLQDECYQAWCGGFICLWTRYVADGEKHGFDTIPGLGTKDSDVDSTIICPKCGWSAPAAEAVPPVPCPTCGTQLSDENISEEESIPVPIDAQDSEVPRGRQVIEAFGALNCKRPQHTKNQSEWHYFAIEREIHYSLLRASAATEDIADKIRPGMNFGPDDAFERNARLAVAENSKLPTQTGAKQSTLVTHVDVWFRPSAYWMLKDKEMRQRAKDIFPRGVHIQFAGNTFFKSEAQSMDDCLATCHAMPGRGQHRPAVGTAEISVQDRFNTFSNISAETYEYGIPITYRASDTFSPEANEDQRAAPGLEVEVALQPGADIRSRVMQTRADSVSPDMQKHMMDLMGPISDQVTGTYPALSGAGEDQPNTLGQQSMQHDQAMGRMGVFYVPLKQLHADITTLACRDYEKHCSGKVNIPVLGDSGDFENESVDVDALEGDAGAYPEGDENFPELWNQQRAIVMQIADTPYGQELKQDMGNAQLFAKMTGIPDLKIPGLDDWQFQLKEIADLIRIPEGEELLTGIAPQVEVENYQNHGVHSACCKWWLNSPRGQKTKRENPLGFDAVVQHLAQHDRMIPPPQPQEKPLTEALNIAFKDMPPEAQAQVLAKLGINVTPQDFLHKLMLDKASKTPKHVPVTSATPSATGAGERTQLNA